jgi:hypothetical protein
MGPEILAGWGLGHAAPLGRLAQAQQQKEPSHP